MRALLQRVLHAEVRVDGEIVGRCGHGLLVLLGVGRDDTPEVAAALAGKVADLRIFRDDDGRTNRSLLEVSGAALVISQFTLYGDTRKGRRPSFLPAAAPELGENLYGRFADALARRGVPVERGIFGAEMEVGLVNDGPMTIWLDTEER